MIFAYGYYAAALFVALAISGFLYYVIHSVVTFLDGRLRKREADRVRQMNEGKPEHEILSLENSDDQ